MTRQERAALREQRLKAALAAKTRPLTKLQAQQWAAARAERAKRRQRVGTLADDAGLFLWEDATRAGLFQIRVRLTEAPDPIKVLDSLLADVGDLSAVVQEWDGAIGISL